MNKDMFVNADKHPFINKDDSNFFMQSEETLSLSNHSEPPRRLNDYDYNILREDAYKDVTDETFKLEYKISKIEAEIKDIDRQILAAKDIKDYDLVENLFSRKKMLIEDYKYLSDIYNSTSLSAKISGGLVSKVKEQVRGIKRRLNDAGENIIARMPGRMASLFELKKSLAKLSNINKSVDELMSMQTPYGETIDRYEQLSKYIVKANNIQAEISKYLR